MPLLSGAEAILKSLELHGVETIFGLPGGQLVHFFDAIYQTQYGDTIKVWVDFQDVRSLTLSKVPGCKVLLNSSGINGFYSDPSGT